MDKIFVMLVRYLWRLLAGAGALCAWIERLLHTAPPKARLMPCAIKLSTPWLCWLWLDCHALARASLPNWAGTLFVLGIILFSGSLCCSFDTKLAGYKYPLGGVADWLGLFICNTLGDHKIA